MVKKRRIAHALILSMSILLVVSGGYYIFLDKWIPGLIWIAVGASNGVVAVMGLKNTSK